MQRLFFFCFLLFVNYTAAAHATTMTDLRVGVHPDKTRLVIDLSKKAQYTTLILANPHRLVIDVAGARWRGGGTSLPEKSGLITSLRHAPHDQNSYRFVLETLAPPRVANAFFLPALTGSGARLVVDIVATDGTTTPDNALAAAATATQSPTPSPQAQAFPKSNGSFNRGKPLIVIDPGHGGKDPGATGAAGTREKELVLMMSKELRDTFHKTGRYKVHLTREDDRFIPLRERPAIAQRMEADLFISVHADAFTNTRARGASIYTLSERASDREAARLAAQENKSDIIAGVDLSGEPDAMTTSILIDLARRETMNLSARFATTMVQHMQKHVNLKQRPHGMAGFMVLTAPDVPSVLLEMGFLTNPQEEWQLKQRSYRAKIADSVVRSTDDFFSWKAALNSQ